MFAKVFKQIFDSSIADNLTLRTFFIDLLILAESDGVVDMTPEAIAARTRRTLDDVNRCLQLLTKPDPRSRTPEEDGRRLVLLDPSRVWGWRIVNYTKYRNMRDESSRKSYMRSYMQNYRDKNKKDLLTPVNSVNTCKPPLAKGDPSPSSYSSSSKEEGSGEKPAFRPMVPDDPPPPPPLDVAPMVKRPETPNANGHGGLFGILQTKLDQAFGRKKGQKWHYEEEYNLAGICRSNPDAINELGELLEFRERDRKFFPSSIHSLLLSWNKTLDRARNFVPEEKPKTLEDKEFERLMRQTKAVLEQ